MARNTISKQLAIASLFLFFVPWIAGFSQEEQSECVFSLQRAERLYQEGVVEDIPDLLYDCIEKGFTRDERLTAYKLIMLSYLYDDNLELADQKMQDFLKRYPEYELTPADQDEFAQLFNSYETKASWSVSITGGMVFTFVGADNTFGAFSTPDSPYDYSSGMGFAVGAGIMKYLAPGLNLNLEFQFLKHEYDYTVTPDFWMTFATSDFTETSSQVVAPLTLSYDFYTGNFKPFLRLGVMPAYMMMSNKNMGRDYTNESFDDLPRSDQEMIDYRNIFNVYAVTGAGLKYKIPYAGQVVIDLRFNMGLMNFVNPLERYTVQDQIFRYYGVNDNYRLNFFNVSLGWIYPLYKSKKKQPTEY